MGAKRNFCQEFRLPERLTGCAVAVGGMAAVVLVAHSRIARQEQVRPAPTAFLPAISAFCSAMLRMTHLAGMYTRALARAGAFTSDD
jgi:hypothetical protein